MIIAKILTIGIMTCAWLLSMGLLCIDTKKTSDKVGAMNTERKTDA